jgi:hypothetical protein
MPGQHCWPRMHGGVHIGAGVERHVSALGMHARRASQQNVPAVQRAVAQNEVVPLSVTTPLSAPPPGQRPRGAQNIPNIVLQHS